MSRPVALVAPRGNLDNYRLYLFAACWLLLAALCCAFPASVLGADAPRAGGREPLTVDAFSVVKVRVKAVSDARSRNTLGGDREGTGIVIDSSGLILTIGYLVQEAELGRSFRRRWTRRACQRDRLRFLDRLWAAARRQAADRQADCLRRFGDGARARARSDRRLRRCCAGLRGVAPPVCRLLGIPARRSDLYRTGNGQLAGRGAHQ